ncbi:MAG TPA: maleylpyruvate isomerase N-terminal domain-containing protein [Streptosporangiaceae bacterium]|jgi:uncharacterized protein (TIGR03086 family)|nr:maleylpyruvate isomerase N-terminal domain-containing protein [Streptosporangiaceae bacterium]
MECPLDQALQGTLAILTKVQPKDLDAPTPCASWDVRALVNHFVGTARWWAATIAGDGDVADADYAVGDFVAAYKESIRIAVAAFGADGALDKTVRLPFGEFPRHGLAEPGHDGAVHPWLGSGARYRATHRSGSRAGRRTAQPGQAGDHRRLPRARLRWPHSSL